MNAKDKGGGTPLHNAALKGHKELAELLIDSGADVNAKDYVGNTPLDRAVGGNHKETADLLRKHGGKTYDWLNKTEKELERRQEVVFLASAKGDIEVVKQQLAAGRDVNAKDKGGGTPLHNAADGGHMEVAELLIAKGADVNAKDNYKRTPLHGAANNGQKEIVELLVTRGADVNAKDYGGNTPLDVAILRNRTGIADLLRKHGGKSGAKDSIHVAANTGNRVPIPPFFGSISAPLAISSSAT